MNISQTTKYNNETHFIVNKLTKEKMDLTE